MGNKLAAARLDELRARIDPSAEAAAALDRSADATQALDLLLEGGFVLEAMRLLAHGLPRREAVWWACMCARHTEPATLRPADAAARELAESWVRRAGDEVRRAAFARAQEAGFGTPEAWAAVAAFWSGDSMSPLGQPPVAPAAELAGTAVAGSVHLASVRPDPAGYPARLLRMLGGGRDIAGGGTGAAAAGAGLMGLPAARMGDMHICPMVTGLVPHVGGAIALGCVTVLTGGQPQARLGDLAVCVGPPCAVALGAVTVLVGGAPAARAGDPGAHGGAMIGMLPTVLIGMTLTLSVLRCPDAIAPETRRIEGGDFSIGRGSDADWPLADPERILSKRHCTLEHRGGFWQVRDTSGNGTFHNRDAEAIGQGRARELRDADRLRLGGYEIEVRIEAPVEPAWTAAAAAPLRDAFDDSIFGRPDDLEAPFDGPTASDHAPAGEHAFTPPRPAPALLPDDEDWLAPIVPAPAAASPFAEPGDPPPPTRHAPAPAQAHSAADDRLMAAFLRGAGLADVVPADPAATMETLGATFRALVVGLRQALMARAAIKGEFRIEQTMVRARGNNPLKFSAGDDDAMLALLGVGRRADMTADRAVADTLRDIRLHELATMAAMQQAVRTLLVRLDPAPLRAEAERAGGLLPGQRRARAFDAYEKLHGQVSAALADDFDSVFGKAFARAYEQALTEAAEKERP